MVVLPLTQCWRKVNPDAKETAVIIECVSQGVVMEGNPNTLLKFLV
jgi:hypothetical protein